MTQFIRLLEIVSYERGSGDKDGFKGVKWGSCDLLLDFMY